MQGTRPAFRKACPYELCGIRPLRNILYSTWQAYGGFFSHDAKRRKPIMALLHSLRSSKEETLPGFFSTVGARHGSDAFTPARRFALSFLSQILDE